MSDEPKTRVYGAHTRALLLADEARTRVLPARQRGGGVAGAGGEPASKPVPARRSARPDPTVSLKPRHARSAERRHAWRWARSLQRAGWPALAAAATLCVALSLVAGLWLARPRSAPAKSAPAAPQPTEAGQAAALPPPQAEAFASAQSTSTADEPAEGEDDDPADTTALEVEPATAVAQLTAGEYAAALRSYRALHQRHPEREVYAAIVAILERRRQRSCSQAGLRGRPC